MAEAVLSALTRRPVLVLTLLALMAWLPGFAGLPPLDRDESRFAQASKQMLESGNWVDIRFGQESRYKKPIGIYWMQAAATEAFGKPPYNAIWTYRLPSLLGALAAVLLTYWCALALGSVEAALAAAALAALSLGIAAEAHIAKTDAVLLAAVAGAQGVLLRLYLASQGKRRLPRLPLVLAGWAALAVGILVKGPVILAVLALTAAGVSFWDKNWKWLAGTRPLMGLTLTLAVVAPWLVAIELASHGAFLNQALGHDFGAKIAGGQETHGAPPGYFLLLSTLTLWPVTLAAIPALVSAWTRRSEPVFRFLLAWIVTNWLLFELVPTKLPHYILPVYPALAILAGIWLTTDTAQSRGWRIAGAAQSLAGTILLGGLIAYAPVQYGTGAPAWLILLASLGVAAGVAASLLIAIDRRLAALTAALLAALIFYPALMWGAAPRLQAIWLSPRIAALVERASRAGDPPVVTSGYDEPSLVFLLGTQTRVAEDGTAAAHIAARDGGLVLTDERQRGAFLAALGRARAVPLGALDGINYSRGKKMHLTLYRVTK